MIALGSVTARGVARRPALSEQRSAGADGRLALVPRLEIWARISSAISAGETPPRSRPTGPWIWSASAPSFSRRFACVRLRAERADEERSAFDTGAERGDVEPLLVHERDERRVRVDLDLVRPGDDELVGARHALGRRKPGPRVDDGRVPADRTCERAERLGDVAGADRDDSRRRGARLRRKPTGRFLAQPRAAVGGVSPALADSLARDDDVARSTLEVGSAREALDEDVDLASARQADRPGLVVGDPIGEDLRRLAADDCFRALGDVRLDAAARDRAEEPAGRRDGELRAERARCAAARSDDGGERNRSSRRRATPLPSRALRPWPDGSRDGSSRRAASRVDAGELGDPLPVLAYVAGRRSRSTMRS